jgi:hypothetical protein
MFYKLNIDIIKQVFKFLSNKISLTIRCKNMDNKRIYETIGSRFLKRILR